MGEQHQKERRIVTNPVQTNFKLCIIIKKVLGFGFQVQHYGTSGWNRFKNKTLGVS